MRFPTCLLLPALLGAASATEEAKVYLFQGNEFPITSNPPTLYPSEARLVFAHRLGVSQYHSLDGADEATLSFINKFGGPQEQLFEDEKQDKAAELIVFVERASGDLADPLLSEWSSIKPAFIISSPPSSLENLELTANLGRQLGPDTEPCNFEDDINPDNTRCWKGGKSNIIGVDLASPDRGIDAIMSAQGDWVKAAKEGKMNVMVILVPDSSVMAKNTNGYGSYDKPQKSLSRRQQAEEPIEDVQAASSPIFKMKQVKTSDFNSSKPLIRGIAPLCYSSLESCQNSTNFCSGHGQCFKKSDGIDSSAPCFACQCQPTREFIPVGEKRINSSITTYWDGGACQKQDVSGPFWLFTTFTIVMVGLVGWAIGMLFSIGEEKLPGVIGAGVSSKTR